MAMALLLSLSLRSRQFVDLGLLFSFSLRSRQLVELGLILSLSSRSRQLVHKICLDCKILRFPPDWGSGDLEN